MLLRAVGDLEVFERALQLCGLRTLASVGAFWGHQQIADLIAYLRALANPLDERALYATLASPLAGCSMDCLALLAQAAHAGGRGVWETALAAVTAGEDELTARLSAADRRALASFCGWMRDERGAGARHTISELLERAIAARGYGDYVLGCDWPERRIANVHKLLRLARRFEASEGRELRAFLDHVAYLQDADRAEPDAPVEGVEPDAVRLMTIHAAKGLEFPVVCVADLGRQPNIQTPDLLVDGERVGLRLVRLDGAGSSPALDYEQLCQERRAREAEEEDRVLYVAMTRARERLLLSGAVDFARWPTPRQAASAISWLGPALCAELPALARTGEAAVHELSIGACQAAGVRCRFNAPSTVGAVLRLDRQQCASGSEPQLDQGPGPQGLGDAAVAPSDTSFGEQLSLSVELCGSDAPQSHVGVRGERGQALPATLSYTSLSELERCGYRYYLERVLGLPEDTAAARRRWREPEREGARPGLQARARGTLIHALMESLDFTRPRPPSSEDVARVARALGLRVGRREREELARLIALACASEPAERVAAAKSVRRECPFAFSPGAGAPLVTGVIDLLARERGERYLVLDYKSDRVDAHEDLEALVQRDYALQRELYALAVLRGAGAEVEVVHWFLERPHEWASARYGERDRDALQARLLERLADASKQQFSVSPTPHVGLCRTCPGRAGMCSWSDAETLRDSPVTGAGSRPFEQFQR